jgi:formamidopyrimidine-DNA glycosylase
MKFPSDWLFRWRWSKGQKQQKATKARQKALESGSDEEGGEDLKPKGMKFLALVSAQYRAAVSLSISRC